MTITLVIEFFFNDEGCEMFTVLIIRKSERMFKTSDDVIFQFNSMFMSLFLI